MNSLDIILTIALGLVVWWIWEHTVPRGTPTPDNDGVHRG